ncbi:hypothetical protein JCM10207_005411 [Rhodosporidiobolus poonsookiae]
MSSASPPFSSSTPPSTPPRLTATSPHLTSPPRSSSLSNRSPRLGQATFDASVGRATPPAYTASPRQLFPAHDPLGVVNASSDTLHIMSGPTSSHLDTSDSKAPVQWELGDEPANSRGRPPQLDLSRDALPHLRYSTVSEVSQDSASDDKAGPSASSTRLQPTLKLLFSLSSRQTFWTVVVPAFLLSLGSGLVGPYMTIVLGEVMQAFSDYAVATSSPDVAADVVRAAGSRLMASSKITIIKFAAIAVGVFVINSLAHALWVVHGERVARDVRLHVYERVSQKGLDWFDKGMGGSDEEEGTEGGEGGNGTAGLMGRFTKDTDDIRLATSQNLGLLVQYLSSFVFCLALCFYRQWMLTFVVLASIPLVVVFTGFTERSAGPLASLLRETTAACSARVDRIIGAIPTVKAFNAEDDELKDFKRLTKDDFVTYCRLHLIWGIRSGVVQFVVLAMFVQGFWFGAWLIRTDRATVAAVNTCFWACVLGSAQVQLVVPILVILEKGKVAMAGLLDITRDEQPLAVIAARSPTEPSSTFSRKGSRRGGKRSSSTADGAEIVRVGEKIGGGPLSPHPFQLASPTSPDTPQTPVLIPLATAGTVTRRKGGIAPRALRKLRPATFSGELSLRGVTFHYPTRPAPAPAALRDVSLYFAARETTYVVGTSGSGKSTVGQLLLGLYRAEQGRVEVDEQGLDWIDEEWLRGHVACVSQGASVLFDGTIHDNVAVGVVGQLQEDGSRRKPKDVSRDEVIAACRGALIHDFIRDLPDGYDTWLSGEKGASLSGGQRQRLAIARAWVRDPTVLILDEATSALDATSRLLVNEAVKRWRENRTTIIITHDLAPIGQDDFVYVMADAQVVEQGYRGDLEHNTSGHFYGMVLSQQGPDKTLEHVPEDDAEVLDLDDDDFEPTFSTPPRAGTRSNQSTPRSLLGTPKIRVTDADAEPRNLARLSGTFLFPAPTAEIFRAGHELRAARRASAHYGQARSRSPSPSPSPRPSSRHGDLLPAFQLEEDDASEHASSKAPLSRTNSEMSLSALEHAGAAAMQNRKPLGSRIKHRTMNEDDLRKWAAKVGAPQEKDDAVVIAVEDEAPPTPRLPIKTLCKRYWSTIPNKTLFVLGIFLSVVCGACTPFFSSLVSQVIANLGTPNNSAIVTKFSLLILLIAGIDGVGYFLKFYFLERCGMGWITALRRQALSRVLKQDKAFFDDPQNTATNLSYCIVKDSDDAQIMVGQMIGQLCVLVTMLGLGIVWALAVGWELTLVGVALLPVLMVMTRVQTVVLDRIESANKLKREAVSRRFHQTMSNIRPIRSMSIQPVFATKFERTTLDAYRGGIKAAPFTGFGAAIGLSMTYFIQGLLMLIGALLIVHGRYDYGRVMQVFSLIVFSVTFASQLMTYLPGITKSLRAANDLLRLLELPTETKESEGRMTFPIQGHVSFSNVEFAYPTRPDVPILKGVDFEIRPGECIGVVGASGSGKSTVAALIQRLYEPSSGSVLLDGRPLGRVDVRYLRDHTAIVSQHPNLFDMTVADNIAYGRGSTSRAEIEAAAKAAHIHEFILSLPKGYDTMLGENASLISGGQAQRLQIARALVQPRELLILDECTSALDPANQKAVMETVRNVKQGRTTLIVTHKLAVMEQCDRLVVVQDGTVAETGTVAELRAKPHGVFAALASGGEWEAS